MTISTTHNRVELVGNGVNGTFPYSYRIFDETDLEVWVDSVLQALTTDYTVTGVDEDQGGNVAFKTASIPIDQASVVILRIVPMTQETDYVEGEKFSPETHERALDRLTCEVQQLADGLARSIKLASTVTDSGGVDLDYDASERASKYIGFDENGDLVVADDLGTWHGDWAADTAYVTADIVVDGAAGNDTKNIYRATSAHTSSVWSTELAAGYWTLMIDVGAVEAAAAIAVAAAAAAAQSALDAEAWHDQGFTLDASPDDHDVSGYRADSLQAGENVVFGSFCYMKSDGKVWKADATDDTKAPCAFMAIETIAADASGEFLVRGFARDDSWSWTVGALLYLSTDVGELTETAPSGTGNVIQPMGIAITATIIMLNPTYGYAEHK
jgi:hypothetical protein